MAHAVAAIGDNHTKCAPALVAAQTEPVHRQAGRQYLKECDVLVIEDELIIGLDLVFTLQQAGCRLVEHASTEEEALDLLQQKPWHAVVADANLNGRTIERIAALLRTRRLPFVVVTGYDSSKLPAAVGDAPVINKPYVHSHVVQIVQRLCGSSRSRNQTMSTLATT